MIQSKTSDNTGAIDQINDDMLICQICMKKIPVMNMVLHEIRCEKENHVGHIKKEFDIEDKQIKQSCKDNHDDDDYDHHEYQEEEEVNMFADDEIINLENDDIELMNNDDDNDLDYTKILQKQPKINNIIDLEKYEENKISLEDEKIDFERPNSKKSKNHGKSINKEGKDKGLKCNVNNRSSRSGSCTGLGHGIRIGDGSIVDDDDELQYLGSLNTKKKNTKNNNSNINTNNLSKETSCRYCGTIVARELIKDHLMFDCINQRLPCEFCQIPIHKNSYYDHIRFCNSNPKAKKKPRTISNHDMITCERCQNFVLTSLYPAHLIKCRMDNNVTADSTVDIMNSKKKNNNTRSTTQIECPICSKNIDAKRFQYHEKSHNRSKYRHQNNLIVNNRNYQTHFINPRQEEIIVERNAIIRVRRNVIPGVDNSAMFIVENFGNGNGNSGTGVGLGDRTSINSISNVIFPSNEQNRGLDKKAIDRFFIGSFDSTKKEQLDHECKNCIICFNDFEHDEKIKFLPCTHRFHVHCIDPWLEMKPTCPSCKRNFKGYGDML